MLTYPSTLPMPDYGSYAGTIDFGVVRTNVPSANASQTINNNSPTTEISMTFTGTNDDILIWQIWVLGNAYQFFNMPVVSAADPTLITSVNRVRFISDIEYQKLGDNWSSATVRAELVPGDFLL